MLLNISLHALYNGKEKESMEVFIYLFLVLFPLKMLYTFPKPSWKGEQKSGLSLSVLGSLAWVPSEDWKHNEAYLVCSSTQMEKQS